MKEIPGDEGDWQKLSAQFATNLNAAPYLLVQLDHQEHYLSNSLDQNTAQQDTNAIFQSQLASLGKQSLNYGEDYSSWDHLPSSLPSAGVPGLASSFQTESGSLGSEMPGSETSTGNYYGDLNMVYKPANTFQMDTVGLSAVNDASPTTGPRNKGKSVLREVQSGFSVDEYFDTTSFQERLEPLDRAAPSLVSDGHPYEEYSSSPEFPALQPHNQYFDEGYGPSTAEGATFDFNSQ